MLRVRQALATGDWAATTQLVRQMHLDDLSRPAHKELKLVRAECDNRGCVKAFRVALSSGGNTSVATILTESIDPEPLTKSLARALKLDVTTDAVRRYAWSAGVISRLRGALREGDWETVGTCVGEAFRDDGDGVDDLVREALPELTNARNAVLNRRAVNKLRSALASGHATGPVGQLAVSTVGLGPLQSAIGEANALPASTPASDALVQVAEAVHELRRLLASQDDNWGDVERVLKRARAAVAEAKVVGTTPGGGGELCTGFGKGDTAFVPAAVVAELDAVQDEVNNTRLVARLTSALSSGVAAGGPGALDLDTIDLAALDAAVEMGRQLGCHTTQAANLLASVEVMRGVRSNMLSGDWVGVGVALQQARDLGPRMSETCSAELALVQDELDNRMIVHQLGEALRHGMATGEVGDLDLDTIDTTQLSAAISASSVACGV